MGPPRRRPRATHLQAYADGVNAYLDEPRPRQIAVEYTRARPAGRRQGRRRRGTRSTRSRGSRRWPGTCAATTTTSWTARPAYSPIGDVAAGRRALPGLPAGPSTPRSSPRRGAAGTAAQQAGDRRRPRSTSTSADLQARAGVGAARRSPPSRTCVGRRRGHRARTRGSSRAATPSRASRCWPTTRTWASRAPGIWAQVGLHCDDVGPPRAPSTSPASPSRASRA